MKSIRMPSSYAMVTEEEKSQLSGGGPFRDAWNSFTDQLHFSDFFFGGGLLTVSISFVPNLLFNVVKTGFNIVRSISDGISSLFGFNNVAEDIQNYTDSMTSLRADYKSKRKS